MQTSKFLNCFPIIFLCNQIAIKSIFDKGIFSSTHKVFIANKRICFDVTYALECNFQITEVPNKRAGHNKQPHLFDWLIRNFSSEGIKLS